MRCRNQSHSLQHRNISTSSTHSSHSLQHRNIPNTSTHSPQWHRITTLTRILHDGTASQRSLTFTRISSLTPHVPPTIFALVFLLFAYFRQSLYEFFLPLGPLHQYDHTHESYGQLPLLDGHPFTPPLGPAAARAAAITAGVGAGRPVDTGALCLRVALSFRCQ